MSDSLHITHVLLNLDVGGLERNVVNQVRYAPKLGQRASIICLENRGALAGQVEALGVQVHCLHRRPGIQPNLWFKLRTLLARLSPHVVHTHQIGTLFYAGPAARWAGVPLVVHTEHGQERYASQWRTRALGRLAGRHARVFFCLTQDMADAAAAHGIVPGEKLRVIHNGIDTAQYSSPVDTQPARHSLGIAPGAPIIGTIGRLTEIKRQDVLIRAFARIAAESPTAHLVLVGDGPLLGELQSLAKAQGVAGRVHFAGYQAKTAPFLQMMDIFALTSRSEGMPQAAIEASVAGVPVVASRVGGLPELIDDGNSGLLFPSGDESALAGALAALLRDPARRKAMASLARERAVARFDISRMCKDYQDCFKRELGAAPVASSSGLTAPVGG